MANKKVPILFQTEVAECGLACIAMILNAHGVDTNVLSLRQRFSISLKGLTLRHITSMASDVGLGARPIRVELPSLKEVKTPAILHWDFNHFVVLVSVSNTGIRIHDPVFGAVTMSFSEASKHFTGVAVEFYPTESLVPPKKVEKLKITHLWSSITGIKSGLIQVVAFSIILQLFVLSMPLYLQVVIDDAITRFDEQMLLMLSVAFLILVVINALTEFLRKILIMKLGHSFTFQIVGNVVRHLLKLPVTFFEKRNIGDIITRMNSIDPIQRVITQDAVASVIDGLMTLIMLAFMLFYSVKLTLIVLFFTAIFCASSLWLIPKIRVFQEKTLNSLGLESSYRIETIRAFRSIKIFGHEAGREMTWRNKYSDFVNDSIDLQRTQFLQETINTLLFALQLTAITYFGALLVIEETLTVGMLFAFLAYRQTFAQRIGDVITNLISFRLASLHLERLSDIALATPEVETSEIDEASISEAPRSIEGSLALDKISFRYSNLDPYILDNLSLTIPAGQYVSIVGASGNGKSTLLKLFLGLINPEGGAILIDGVPLTRIGLRTWRSQIGVVMQDDTLLTGTFLDNITFFDHAPDMDLVHECAKAAQIHDDISAMPMEYLSLVGDMGVALSGGQRQRLFLARALYQEPKIIFLDEGTANLDEESERAIGEAISSMSITRVVIAHRPELIRRADVVYRLDGGELTRVVTGAEAEAELVIGQGQN
ncbi:MAG: ATP-binding cassette subfamily B protein RaxB [Arenicella sp.]|jgi:ATP-binding cassette subfamily B protein RaxB